MNIQTWSVWVSVGRSQQQDVVVGSVRPPGPFHENVLVFGSWPRRIPWQEDLPLFAFQAPSQHGGCNAKGLRIPKKQPQNTFGLPPIRPASTHQTTSDLACVRTFRLRSRHADTLHGHLSGHGLGHHPQQLDRRVRDRCAPAEPRRSPAPAGDGRSSAPPGAVLMKGRTKTALEVPEFSVTQKETSAQTETSLLRSRGQGPGSSGDRPSSGTGSVAQRRRGPSPATNLEVESLLFVCREKTGHCRHHAIHFHDCFRKCRYNHLRVYIYIYIPMVPCMAGFGLEAACSSHGAPQNTVTPLVRRVAPRCDAPSPGEVNIHGICLVSIGGELG